MRIRVHDCKTNKIVDRDMTPEEEAAFVEYQDRMSRVVPPKTVADDIAELKARIEVLEVTTPATGSAQVKPAL